MEYRDRFGETRIEPTGLETNGRHHEKKPSASFSAYNWWWSKHSRSAAATGSSRLQCAVGLVLASLDGKGIRFVRATGDPVHADLHGRDNCLPGHAGRGDRLYGRNRYCTCSGSPWRGGSAHTTHLYQWVQLFRYRPPDDSSARRPPR